MKEIFIKLLNAFHNRENVNIIEVLMYESGEFAKIVYESEGSKYTIGITKEKNNGNS